MTYRVIISFMTRNLCPNNDRKKFARGLENISPGSKLNGFLVRRCEKISQRNNIRGEGSSPPRRSLRKLYLILTCNEGISAASFCHQGATLVPDMFCNFYLVKNGKAANNSATTEARDKISIYLENLEF
jgi:hypothetical protein